MKKYLAITLTLMLAAACVVGCSPKKSGNYDAGQLKALFANTDVEDETEAFEVETPSTVYLNSTRSGAVTKAANPVVGINFDVIDNNYDIVKTNSNFEIDPIYGGGDPFYVMFDSPDEVVVGDFEYGFATAISTKWEDLLHIYDLENEVVYKVVTPKDTNRIKKIGEHKFAVQCGSAAEGYKSYSFSTSEKYAYDMYMNDDDVVMIVDGGHEYDIAKELAQESEGATTTPEELAEAGEETASDTEGAAETDTSSGLQMAAAEQEAAASAEAALDAPAANDDTQNPENTENPAQETPAQEEGLQAETDTETETFAETIPGEFDEEEIETAVVQTANDKVDVEISDDQIYVAEETEEEEAALHRDIPGGRIINAPVIAQFPYYPTGCESVSTVMALNYHGVDISVDDFINKYLDKDTGFYIKDGLKFGPSPFEYFIGNPYDSSGFGCMSSVIYNALMKIYDDNKMKVVDAGGLSMEELCKDYINQDLPVMVWVNICMVDAFESNTWHLEDGSEFVWQANEHCMLLVGYDDNSYYFNDPYTGEIISYGKAVSEKCFEQRGMQAIVIMN